MTKTVFPIVVAVITLQTLAAPVCATSLEITHTFTGHEPLKDVGLIHMGGRIYDPKLGRFLSPDPIIQNTLNSQNLNRYSYVLNNPLNASDPTGYSTKGNISNGSFGALGLATGVASCAETLGVGCVLSIAANGFMLADAVQKQISALHDNKKSFFEKQLGSKTYNGFEIAESAYFIADMGISLLSSQSAARLTKEGKAGQCFVAGTLVSTADGLKPIETIQVGDLVYAKDEHTGDVALKPVANLVISPNNPNVGEIVLADEHGEVETTGVSSEHPYYVAERGWIDAQQLQPGMILETIHGGRLTVDQVWKKIDNTTTYNFEVADYHTYFVGRKSAWVHNMNECRGGGSTQDIFHDAQEDIFYDAHDGYASVPTMIASTEHDFEGVFLFQDELENRLFLHHALKASNYHSVLNEPAPFWIIAHGDSSAIFWIGERFTPDMLANNLREYEFKEGQKIILSGCDTGCGFAQVLANRMNRAVYAPLGKPTLPRNNNETWEVYDGHLPKHLRGYTGGPISLPIGYKEFLPRR